MTMQHNTMHQPVAPGPPHNAMQCNTMQYNKAIECTSIESMIQQCNLKQFDAVKITLVQYTLARVYFGVVYTVH